MRLPLQKAQALDPAGDAYNDEIDATVREQALAQRGQCYEIIIGALRSLKGDTLQREFGTPIRSTASQSALDPASRKKYICQIVQLGVQSPDRIFHEYLYQAMIDLGLDRKHDELLASALEPGTYKKTSSLVIVDAFAVEITEDQVICI